MRLRNTGAQTFNMRKLFEINANPSVFLCSFWGFFPSAVCPAVFFFVQPILCSILFMISFFSSINWSWIIFGCSHSFYKPKPGTRTYTQKKNRTKEKQKLYSKLGMPETIIHPLKSPHCLNVLFMHATVCKLKTMDQNKRRRIEKEKNEEREKKRKKKKRAWVSLSHSCVYLAGS